MKQCQIILRSYDLIFHSKENLRFPSPRVSNRKKERKKESKGVKNGEKERERDKKMKKKNQRRNNLPCKTCRHVEKFSLQKLISLGKKTQ